MAMLNSPQTAEDVVGQAVDTAKSQLGMIGSDGRPSGSQIDAWKAGEGEDKKYKGYALTDSGWAPVYVSNKSPEVQSKQEQEDQAAIQKGLDRVNNAARIDRDVRMNEATKATKAIISNGGEQPFDMEIGMSAKEITGTVMNDPLVTSDPYLQYSTPMRDMYEKEIALGKAGSSWLPGMKKYLEDKNRYESLVRTKVNEMKGKQWEAMKWDSFRADLKAKEISIAAAQQQLADNEAAAINRQQQYELARAKAELARRQALSEQANKQGVGATEVYDLVSQGAGMSRQRAESVARMLPEGAREAFIRQAVSNLENATMSPDAVIDSIRRQESGQVTSGKISVSEEKAIAKAVAQARKAGLPDAQVYDAGLKIIGGDKSNAAANEVIRKAMTGSATASDVRDAVKLHEEQQVSRYSNALTVAKGIASRLSAGQLLDEIARTNGYDRFDASSMDDKAVEGMVRRFLLEVAGNSTTANNIMTTNLSRESGDTEERRFVDSTTQKLVGEIGKLKTSSVVKEVSQSRSIATSIGVQPKTIVSVAFGDKMLSAYVPRDDVRELVEKNLRDAIASGDNETIEQIKNDLGAGVGGILGVNLRTEDDVQEFKKKNYKRFPEEQMAVALKTEEARKSAKVFWRNGNDFQKGIVSSVVKGDFSSPVIDRAVAGIETAMNEYPDTSALPQSDARTYAREWYNKNFETDKSLGFSSKLAVAIAKDLLTHSVADTAARAKAGKLVPPEKRFADLEKFDPDSIMGPTSELRDSTAARKTDAAYRTIGSMLKEKIENRSELKAMWSSDSASSKEAAVLLASEEVRIDQTDEMVGRYRLMKNAMTNGARRTLSDAGLPSDLDAATAFVNKMSDGPSKQSAATVLRDAMNEVYSQASDQHRQYLSAKYRITQLGALPVWSNDRAENTKMIKESYEYEQRLEKMKDVLHGLDLIKETGRMERVGSSSIGTPGSL